MRGYTALLLWSLATTDALAPGTTALTRRAWAERAASLVAAGASLALAPPDALADGANVAAPTARKLSSGLEYTDLRTGGSTDKAIADKTQLVIDYTVFRADGTTALESSKDTRRMPFAFTVGTGAVHRAIDEAVRDMKPGDVRRVAVPAGYDKGSQISEAVVVQIRLRNIKGPSELNICAVPPIEVGPSILCQPGVGRVML